jgi:hypothetical protein
VIEAALALKHQAGSKGDSALTTDLEIPKCLVVETASYCRVPPPPGPLVIRIEMLPGNPAKPPGL